VHFLSVLAADLHFALRMVRQNLVFSSVAILSLALGIGDTSAMSSLVYAPWVIESPLRTPAGARWNHTVIRGGLPGTSEQHVDSGRDRRARLHERGRHIGTSGRAFGLCFSAATPWPYRRSGDDRPYLDPQKNAMSRNEYIFAHINELQNRQFQGSSRMLNLSHWKHRG
jgi:hypothetical protein